MEGFLRAYDFSAVPAAWRETVERVVRQRLSAHEHPEAVADALEAVSRSRPFEDLGELAAHRGARRGRREPRRGRPRAPAGAGRALRAGDSRGNAHRRGRRGGRASRPLSDRVAGGAALQGARRAARAGALGLSETERTCVIAYVCMSVREWDGSSYDRISGPMEALGRAVLDRLELNGDETVLDAGCGSGRVTQALLERLPRGRVIAVDASRLDDAGGPRAARRIGARPAREVREADLLDELELDAAPRRGAVDGDLPLDRRPRSAVRAPARRAAPGGPAGRAVRGGGQHRRAARGRARDPRARTLRRALPRLARALELRGPRAHPRTPARARASPPRGAGSRRPRSSPSTPASSSRRSCSAHTSSSCPRLCATPSWTRCSPSWGSRWSSTMCA